jgi:endogenous inhibitor of DNA gyrase (YacG/DUF329 family)
MRIRCPRCGELTTWEENPYRPFCSERCKLLDLGAWASGDYKIPGRKEEEEDETTNEDQEG